MDNEKTYKEGVYENLENYVLNPNQFGVKGNLTKNLMRYHSPKGSNIIQRTDGLMEWIDSRGDAGLFQFGLSWQDLPGTTVVAKNYFNKKVAGYNFTSVDYLGLATDRRLVDAAVFAAENYGVHSVSVAALIGNSPISEALEKDMCEWLGYKHCLLFPTGWAASFGAVVGLVRNHDFILMDELAHASLQQGAYAATENVQKFKHLDNNDAEMKLREIRRQKPDAAILVITEGMYSMDGDVPNLAALQELCERYSASLMVDICHDLAASGPNGTGTLGAQGLLGRVDIVVGAFSKSLASNGGFMLVNNEGARMAVRFFGGSYTYSSAVSPLQIAVAREAIKICRSEEGEQMRARLREVSQRLRSEFRALGFRVYGEDSSHIVPLHLGREGFARIAGGRAYEKGVVATVIEFPVVTLGAARYRFSMKPTFSNEELDDAVERTAEAFGEAEGMWDAIAHRGGN
jgi:7-keto-8-aminopelargonate synthetase-like enzyme